ncbi:MAG: hypothetical protein AB1489_07315 [Acidobacteriota bacterium]
MIQRTLIAVFLALLLVAPRVFLQATSAQRVTPVKKMSISI